MFRNTNFTYCQCRIRLRRTIHFTFRRKKASSLVGAKEKLCSVLMTTYFTSLQLNMDRKLFTVICCGTHVSDMPQLPQWPRMKNDNSVCGLEVFSKNENREPCQPFALNKSTIENIPKASRDVSKEKFDLTYSDICGLFPKSVEKPTLHGVFYR